MGNLRVKVSTAWSLGLSNLLRVFCYRFGVKVGINPVKRLQAKIESGVFFKYPKLILPQNYVVPDTHLLLGWIHYDLSKVPSWHCSILTGSAIANPQQSWWEIPDFSDELGDIKGVWEHSRFDWMVKFAQSASLGDAESLNKLNLWLSDWVRFNPPYLGVNWKCGQEASIRIMHLALTVKLLGQIGSTSPALLSLVKAHLKRISPTIIYAVAQDNNHGTSEAAALFIGGSWLLENGDSEGEKWFEQGVKWLENRAQRLILGDGSFSQYSTTYHRVMLDTYSFVEVWRRDLKLAPFSDALYTKLSLASSWLYTLTQVSNGDAPNLGANDGARLLPLTQTDYRDFRPSVQLSCALFHNKSAYIGSGPYDKQLEWLNITKPSLPMPSVGAIDFACGGYACLKVEHAFVLFKYPNYVFRPSQNDTLHVDFWLSGQNILRDGGTFSYNAGQKYIDYYGGVESHNTAQFDNHQPMPRLSRFLLGGWLKAIDKKKLVIVDGRQTISVGYEDRFSCLHIRKVTLEKSLLSIIDELSGFIDSVVVRWRLMPGDWSIDGTTVSCEFAQVHIKTDVEIKRIELVTGYESRYYYQETRVPVLEVEIARAGLVTTEIRF